MDPFSPESIAAIANELFHAATATAEPISGPAEVDAGVVPDIVAGAVGDPATSLDVSSTSVPGAPTSGAAGIYNPGTAYDLPGHDLTGFGLLDGGSLGGDPAAEPEVDVSGSDLGVADSPVDLPGDASVSSFESDAAFLLAAAGDPPADQVDVIEETLTEHPYLEARYTGLLADSGQSDAGAGEVAGSLLESDEFASIATEFSGEHVVAEDFGPLIDPAEAGDVAGVEASEHDVPAEVTTSAAATPVEDAEATSEIGLPEASAPSAGNASTAAMDDSFAPSLVPSGVEEVPDLGIAATTTGFNPDRIREDFPILRERINGRELVWLDNGATTQKPQQVIDRLSYFYEHENSNVHRTAHTLAGRATDAYEGARNKVRDFIHAPSSDDIIWVRGTTEGINLIANTFGEQNISEGDEVLITWLEHHANIVPWQMLCARKGATLRVAPVDSTGQVILSEFERLITPRTKVVSFTHVSNALGTVTPAADMVAIAHRHGVPVVIDGAQGVLHMPVDVQELDCDFYVFSGHKMFAPTGIGVVYGKAEVLDKLPPWQGGGNMIDQVYFDRTTYQPPPWRFEAGTGSIADAVGLGSAIDYLNDVGMTNVAAYEHELLAYGTELLLAVPGLTIFGTAAAKAGVLSFNIEGHDAVAVGKYLDECAIAVRAGHHCAQPILRRFGVEETVRAALALYNTRADLERLADALQRLVSGTPAQA